MHPPGCLNTAAIKRRLGDRAASLAGLGVPQDNQKKIRTVGGRCSAGTQRTRLRSTCSPLPTSAATTPPPHRQRQHPTIVFEGEKITCARHKKRGEGDIRNMPPQGTKQPQEQHTNAARITATSAMMAHRPAGNQPGHCLPACLFSRMSPRPHHWRCRPQPHHTPNPAHAAWFPIGSVVTCRARPRRQRPSSPTLPRRSQLKWSGHPNQAGTRLGCTV